MQGSCAEPSISLARPPSGALQRRSPRWPPGPGHAAPAPATPRAGRASPAAPGVPAGLPQVHGPAGHPQLAPATCVPRSPPATQQTLRRLDARGQRDQSERRVLAGAFRSVSRAPRVVVVRLRFPQGRRRPRGARLGSQGGFQTDGGSNGWHCPGSYLEEKCILAQKRFKN